MLSDTPDLTEGRRLAEAAPKGPIAFAAYAGWLLTNAPGLMDALDEQSLETFKGGLMIAWLCGELAANNRLRGHIRNRDTIEWWMGQAEEQAVIMAEARAGGRARREQ